MSDGEPVPLPASVKTSLLLTSQSPPDFPHLDAAGTSGATDVGVSWCMMVGGEVEICKRSVWP